MVQRYRDLAPIRGAEWYATYLYRPNALLAWQLTVSLASVHESPKGSGIQRNSLRSND